MNAQYEHKRMLFEQQQQQRYKDAYLLQMNMQQQEQPWELGNLPMAVDVEHMNDNNNIFMSLDDNNNNIIIGNLDDNNNNNIIYLDDIDDNIIIDSRDEEVIIMNWDADHGIIIIENWDDKVII
jgi:hypothetical protein